MSIFFWIVLWNGNEGTKKQLLLLKLDEKANILFMCKALTTNWDTFVWHCEHENVIIIIFLYLVILINVKKNEMVVNDYWQNFVFLTKENILSLLLLILCSDSSFLNNNQSQDKWLLDDVELFLDDRGQSPAPPPHFCCHGF